MSNASCQSDIEQFRGKLQDARLLLNWALTEMRRISVDQDPTVTAANPATIPKAIIDAVAEAEGILPDSAEPDQSYQISIQDRIDLDEAIQTLSAITAPVSIETLKATQSSPGKRPRAESFHRGLIQTALTITLGVVFCEVLLNYSVSFWPTADAEDAHSPKWYYFLLLLEQLEPFLYGALGATAFLLQAAKQFINRRSFDMNRRYEYYTRLALGTVSGGAAALLVETVVLDDGAVQLGAGVMGFIGGYSTDFLYKFIGRLIEAIFPNVDARSPRAARRSVADMAGGALPASTLTTLMMELLTRLEHATNEDEKKKILELLDSLKSRIGSV